MKCLFFITIATIFSCNSTVVTDSDNGSKSKDNTGARAARPAPPADTIDFTKIDYTGPAAIVYKTRNNYYDNVPVTMDDVRSRIVSYPAPQDLFYKGKLALPTQLEDDYLLDNRGINKNVGFLKYTYEAYSMRKEAPSMDSLRIMLLDPNPLEQMYDCGNRNKYKNEVSELNYIIENQQLPNFRKIN